MFKNFMMFVAAICMLGLTTGCGGPGETTTMDDRPSFGKTTGKDSTAPPIEGMEDYENLPDGVVPH